MSIKTRNQSKLFFGQGRYPLRTYRTKRFVGTSKSATKKTVKSKIGICTICFVKKNVYNIPLSCRHSAACIKCLRKYYVKQSQQSRFNYPLRCLQSGCLKTVSVNSMIRIGLFKTIDEVKRHSQLLQMRQNDVNTVATNINNISHLFAKNIRNCPRCNQLITKVIGTCNKMKCVCGFKFCFKCGVVNAKCNCTNHDHAFYDNTTGNLE